jgi:hypothetical protein
VHRTGTLPPSVLRSLPPAWRGTCLMVAGHCGGCVLPHGWMEGLAVLDSQDTKVGVYYDLADGSSVRDTGGCCGMEKGEFGRLK